MPNAKVLSEKQAIVAELTEKIQKASAGVLVDYKGITVEEDTALRRECRENGVDYAVVKNTLLRFAFNNTGLNELDGLLNGTTSLALCDSDVVAPARVMSDYAKKLNDKFEIKGGFMDGKPVSLETIQSLASIPALPVLQAQFLGTMLAPITGLAVVLKQIAEKGGEPVAAAEEAGIWACGYNCDMTEDGPNAHLTAPIWHWGIYVTEQVQAVIDGTWEPVNRLEGMNEGWVDISPLTENCAEGTEEAVAAAREAISTGELQIFSGEITDNEGNVVVAEGQTLSDAEILAITWFCEGITVN